MHAQEHRTIPAGPQSPESQGSQTRSAAAPLLGRSIAAGKKKKTKTIVTNAGQQVTKLLAQLLVLRLDYSHGSASNFLQPW